MHATHRFSLASIGEKPPPWEYRRRLLLDGEPTGAVVEGDEIERQYACGELFLLIISYDYYTGVEHTFYVVDGRGRVKDLASTPDQGFLERDSLVEGESQLSFGFFGGKRWTLAVREGGFWSFTAADLARRAGRFLLHRRYLSLSRRARAPVAAA